MRKVKVKPQPVKCHLLLTGVLGNKGNWIATTPFPGQTLEMRERRLRGKDQELLLTHVRRVLRWLPEDRPSAEGLFEDEFLMQHNLES